MTNLSGLPTRELLNRLQNGELSSVDLTKQSLSRIASLDSKVRAFLAIQSDAALDQASEIDSRRSAGKPLGKLAGIPIAIKDVLCTKGIKTTCGSRILENFIPPYDAHVVDRLRREDAIIVGKTNMDEFAMGSSTENSAYQITKNPWGLDRVPGGSSGGSAAAVSANMVPVAIGSDTGGSIRQPASFCGTVGIKPTYGRVSRYGLIAYASSLDQVGPFSNDVYGAALLTEIISGHDQRDSTSVNRPVEPFSQTCDLPLQKLRIGVAEEHFAEGLDDEVRKTIETALDVYRKLGATIEKISLPHQNYAVAVYYIIAPCEASSNLARFDGVHYGHRASSFKSMIDMYSQSRGEAFGAEVKRRIMIGTYALSAGYYDAYYLKALKVRRLIREDFNRAFEKVDVIMSPASPHPASLIGEFSGDPLAMYLADLYTISANLAGIPGISVPAGFSSQGLPIGLQILGAPFQEDNLFRAARMFEQATDWHTKRPTL